MLTFDPSNNRVKIIHLVTKSIHTQKLKKDCQNL